MASFDIVSQVDMQKLDNAINVVNKEISTRYDFHNSQTEIELDKKEWVIKITTENDMRMDAIRDIIIGRGMKQGVDPNSFDFGKDQYASGNMIKKDVKIKKKKTSLVYSIESVIGLFLFVAFFVLSTSS